MPQGDLVRYVDLLIESLDLSKIDSHYSEQGRPAFHPKTLVKLIVYGKMRNIRSSRKLALLASENLRFIYLLSNERPDFRTILRFRDHFHKELANILKQTIHIGIKKSFITLNDVSIDGTKIRAMASANSFKRPKHLERLLAELEASLAEDIALDRLEDEEHGNSDGLSRLPKECEDKEVLAERIRDALEHYEDIEESPKKVSLTDPEARFMKSKGVSPSYNAQIAVDVDSDMVVGGYVTNSGGDQKQLIPMLASIEVESGGNPVRVHADKGYCEIEGLVELKRRGIDGYIPQREEPSSQFSRHHFIYSSGRYICPAKRELHFIKEDARHRIYRSLSCAGCVLRDSCMRSSGRNKSLYISRYIDLIDEMRSKTVSALGGFYKKLRSSSVERVIGHIKWLRGLRQFRYRSKWKVDACWKLELAAYNIEKLARAMQRQAIANS